jgi:hypothetical protein
MIKIFFFERKGQRPKLDDDERQAWRVIGGLSAGKSRGGGGGVLPLCLVKGLVDCPQKHFPNIIRRRGRIYNVPIYN